MLPFFIRRSVRELAKELTENYKTWEIEKPPFSRYLKVCKRDLRGRRMMLMMVGETKVVILPNLKLTEREESYLAKAIRQCIKQNEVKIV